MLLTIGIIVGFVLGFVLFLSGMPEENYTLVETERAVESYETTEASQFGFYDNLPGVKEAVPNVKADQMPAFSRQERTGRYGAGTNERPSAVQIADEFHNVDGVEPIELTTATASTTASAAGTAGLTAGSAAVARTDMRTVEAAARTNVQEPTIIKKVPNAPKTFYYLQAGAFSRQVDAVAMQSTLRSSGMDAFIHKVRKEGKLLHRGYLVIKVQS